MNVYVIYGEFVYDSGHDIILNEKFGVYSTQESAQQELSNMLNEIKEDYTEEEFELFDYKLSNNYLLVKFDEDNYYEFKILECVVN